MIETFRAVQNILKILEHLSLQINLKRANDHSSCPNTASILSTIDITQLPSKQPMRQIYLAKTIQNLSFQYHISKGYIEIKVLLKCYCIKRRRNCVHTSFNLHINYFFLGVKLL